MTAQDPPLADIAAAFDDRLRRRLAGRLGMEPGSTEVELLDLVSALRTQALAAAPTTSSTITEGIKHMPSANDGLARRLADALGMPRETPNSVLLAKVQNMKHGAAELVAAFGEKKPRNDGATDILSVMMSVHHAAGAPLDKKLPELLEHISTLRKTAEAKPESASRGVEFRAAISRALGLTTSLHSDDSIVNQVSNLVAANLRLIKNITQLRKAAGVGLDDSTDMAVDRITQRREDVAEALEHVQLAAELLVK